MTCRVLHRGLIAVEAGKGPQKEQSSFSAVAVTAVRTAKSSLHDDAFSRHAQSRCRAQTLTVKRPRESATLRIRCIVAFAE